MKKTRKIILIIIMFIFIIGIKDVYANEFNLEKGVYILNNELNLKDSIKRSKYNALMTSDEVTSYNLKDEFSENNIELLIKNQHDSQACWAFAFTNLLESSFAKKYNRTPNPYSPMHIEYRTAQIYNRNLKSGGANPLALAYVVSGQGPVLEDRMKFEDYYDLSSESYRYTKENIGNIEKNPDLKINKAVFVSNIYKGINGDQIVYYSDSNRTNVCTQEEVNAIRNQVKEHIKTYGSISANVKFSDYEDYYNEDTKSFCYDNYDLSSGGSGGLAMGDNDNSIVPDHAVTIVGWDDNYSVDNFNNSHKPASKGAYIVQNSYGSEWGDEGLFYISYDDVFIESDLLGILDLEEKNNEGNFGYDYLYQYDELGMNAGLPIREDGNPIYGANVFTKKNNENDKDEYINEIALYIYKTSGVEVFVNNQSDDISGANTKVLSLTGSDALEAGYHSIKLDTPIKIEGDKFVIKVKYINQENPVLPMEINLTEFGFNEGDSELYDTASANDNEGFFSNDDTTWYDINNTTLNMADGSHSLKNSSLCIKAFSMLREKENDETNTTNTTDTTNTTNTTDTTNTTNTTDETNTTNTTDETNTTNTTDETNTTNTTDTTNTTNTTDETNTTNTTDETNTTNTNNTENDDKEASDVDDIYTDKKDTTKITPAKTDSTTSSKKLPNTGINKFLIIGFIITITSGIVMYLKYRSLKEVK